MEEDEIKSDVDVLEEWEKLPKGSPSKQALPPATGGLVLGYKVLGGLFIIIVLITFLSLILN